MSSESDKSSRWSGKETIVVGSFRGRGYLIIHFIIIACHGNQKSISCSATTASPLMSAANRTVQHYLQEQFQRRRESDSDVTVM